MPVRGPGENTCLLSAVEHVPRNAVRTRPSEPADGIAAGHDLNDGIERVGSRRRARASPPRAVPRRIGGGRRDGAGSGHRSIWSAHGFLPLGDLLREHLRPEQLSFSRPRQAALLGLAEHLMILDVVLCQRRSEAHGTVRS